MSLLIFSKLIIETNFYMGLLKYDIQYDLDDPKTTLVHRDIIKSKPFLRKLYEEWYNIFITHSESLPAGTLLEIGSGGGFLKEVFPGVTTSDIMPLESCDMTFSAESIPFKGEELSAIFMVNVLHHIPNSKNFFSEAQRTLKTNGKIIMVEPANSIFGRFIYRNFHHEPFDPTACNWEIPFTGPLSGANGALPWIIFERDKKTFEESFPNLKIKSIHYQTPFRYLLSGGVSMKCLVPDKTFGLITAFEKMLNPLSKYIGMFQTIVIEKK